MGGGVKDFKVPHWSTYKVGPHTPELHLVERMLASHGLKDPWLRNQVWRFDRNNPQIRSPKENFRWYMTRGLKTGLALGVLHAAYTFYARSKDPHHHH